MSDYFECRNFSAEMCQNGSINHVSTTCPHFPFPLSTCLQRRAHCYLLIVFLPPQPSSLLTAGSRDTVQLVTYAPWNLISCLSHGDARPLGYRHLRVFHYPAPNHNNHSNDSNNRIKALIFPIILSLLPFFHSAHTNLVFFLYTHILLSIFLAFEAFSHFTLSKSYSRWFQLPVACSSAVCVRYIDCLLPIYGYL